MNGNTETQAEWEAPLPGHWRRDFRLAEWLPGPVTRSCETWLLPALDRGFSEASLEEYGSGTKPGVVVVNGWCFATDPMPTKPVGMLTHAPLRLIRISAAMARMATRPEAVERHIAGPGLDRYRSVDLPALQRAIGAAQDVSTSAALPGPIDAVDGLAVATGRLMLGMVQSLGFAGKVEYATATFFAEHLAGKVDCTPLDLAIGLSTPLPTPPHAVTSLDWVEPTAGERATASAPSEEVHQHLVRRRTAAEAECRTALAGDIKAVARFDTLTAMLARWVPVRETMAAEFTIAWPTMRALLERIGATLVDAGAIAVPTDVFELSRDEILAGEDGDARYHGIVEARQAQRDAQRRLTPPTSLGKPVRQWKRIDEFLGPLRSGAPASGESMVVGVGTSPGRVTGIARVILGPDDFASFRPGEIMVAPATAPAWTALLGIAAGAVTDGGSPFAHVSVVAREYGIPAIVSTGDATRRITSGTMITIDAASGAVTRATSAEEGATFAADE